FTLPNSNRPDCSRPKCHQICYNERKTRGLTMKLTERQQHIIEIVKENEPISGDKIAHTLGLTKSTLRSDLAVLTMTGILDARPKVGYIYSGLGFQPMIQDRLSSLTVEDIMLAPVSVKQETTVQDAITALF